MEWKVDTTQGGEEYNVRGEVRKQKCAVCRLQKRFVEVKGKVEGGKWEIEKKEADKFVGEKTKRDRSKVFPRDKT
jgi:hypothetical protein